MVKTKTKFSFAKHQWYKKYILNFPYKVSFSFSFEPLVKKSIKNLNEI